MSVPRPGAKLRCTSCGSQLVVVKPPADLPTCCGQALEPVEKKAGVSGGQ